MKVVQEGNFEDEIDEIDIPINKGQDKGEPKIEPISIKGDNSMTIFLVIMVIVVVAIIAYLNNKDND